MRKLKDPKSYKPETTVYSFRVDPKLIKKAKKLYKKKLPQVISDCLFDLTA